MKYHFEIFLLACVLAPCMAHARLGEASFAARNDHTLISGSKVTTESHTGCYDVVNIDAPGGHVKEFVNTANDKVFMVAAISRAKMNFAKFLTDSDRQEYLAAPKTLNARHTKTHAHQSLSSETARLKVRSSADHGIFRNVMILKSAVPATCVANPESLL